ncbi:hypothetical protein CRUP_033083 [Coryphaenoides rupestris]|nr:hypothetical protein CRUP_033083 [Coryphaenoides rupestris]
MEEGSLPLLSLPSSPFTSVTERGSPSLSHSVGPPRSRESEGTLKPGVQDMCDGEERLVTAKENFSLFGESIPDTSDEVQEKVLLLNKNTELRRVNQELMKLNEEWDRVYRNATAVLQQRVESLVQENAAAKQLNKRLLLKVEHQQSARDYYEHVLLQELKRNQELQAYVGHLEQGCKGGKPGNNTACTAAGQQGLPDFVPNPQTDVVVPSSSDAPVSPTRPASCHGSSRFRPPGGSPSSSTSSTSSSSTTTTSFSTFIHQEAGPPDAWTHNHKPDGTRELKEQLEALRCQTQIYEAEFQTEHKDHKNTQQENRRLRRKREEMRQQVALLQEQLKVYEDDFRKERSDKLVLQRLLLKKKTSASKDPVLVHRCNNDMNPPGGDKRTQSDWLK